MEPDRRDAADEAVVCMFVGLRLDPGAFFAGGQSVVWILGPTPPPRQSYEKGEPRPWFYAVRGTE